MALIQHVVIKVCAEPINNALSSFKKGSEILLEGDTIVICQGSAKSLGNLLLNPEWDSSRQLC